MNKQQTVWLIVRLIGVYFAYWAIVAFLGLISAIYGYVSVPSATSSTKSNTNSTRVQAPTPVINPAIPTVKTEEEKAAEKAKSEVSKEVFWQLFLTLIYGAVGFYLIRNGKHLFAVLHREEFVDDADESVSLQTNKEKVVTTRDLSSSKKEEVTSLNLSEYVPKPKESAPPIVENEQIATDLKEELSSPIDLLNEQITPPEIVPQSAPNELPNQPFFADEQPTVIRETAPTETDLPAVEKPNEQVELPNVESLAEEKPPIIEEIVPTETASVIDEQPNEQSAPSDVSADAPLEEKK